MISPQIDQAINDTYADLRKKFEDAFAAKVAECLQVLVPGFAPDQLEAFAPRITIVSVEGQRLKEVYLDADGVTYGSGTYLFCYSDELTTTFENGQFSASIG